MEEFVSKNYIIAIVRKKKKKKGNWFNWIYWIFYSYTIFLYTVCDNIELLYNIIWKAMLCIV